MTRKEPKKKSGLASLFGRLRRQRNQPAIEDRRRLPRDKMRFEAAVSTAQDVLHADGIDWHRHGAKIVAKRPTAIGSTVFVHLKGHGLMGFGTVRYCTERSDWRYDIGLEFPTSFMQEEVGDWQLRRVSVDRAELWANDMQFDYDPNLFFQLHGRK